VTQYQISFDYLKEFAKYKKKKSFEYAEMNKAFYDSYIKFLQSKDLASNTIGAKIKQMTIMSITGHTTESSFLTYIKVGKDEHAQKMMEHWNRIYSGSGNY
jgi:mannosyltransferase OCH1-like enzyme